MKLITYGIRDGGYKLDNCFERGKGDQKKGKRGIRPERGQKQANLLTIFFLCTDDGNQPDNQMSTIQISIIVLNSQHNQYHTQLTKLEEMSG